jgi:hypothetical protein
VWSGWTREQPRRRLLASALLAAAIAAASYRSPAAWTLHEPPVYGPKPELLPLVARAAECVPENERLIVESRVKCHTILFYGRRAIDGSELWLLSKVAPGETRYSIFLGEHPPRLPFVRRELVDRAGRWKLFRLTVEAGDRPWGGILLAKPDQRDALANTMALLNVGVEPFDNGFILRRIPESPALPAGPGRGERFAVTAAGVRNVWDRAPSARILQKGDAVVWRYARPIACGGVDLYPESRRAAMSGWLIQGRDAAGGTWRDLKRVDGSFEPYYTVSDGRVRRASRGAVRVRFDPVDVTELRIERTDAAPIAISDAQVFGVDKPRVTSK